jgi:hypothetical protein
VIDGLENELMNVSSDETTMRDLPALKEATFAELKRILQNKYPKTISSKTRFESIE